MSDKKVDFSYLGKSGIRVSNICLGTLTFGQPKTNGLGVLYPVPSSQASEKLSHKIMDKYAELGGNFLDTANIYQSGHSEEIVGSWLSKQERSRFVLATKVRFNMDRSDVNQVGLSRRHIVESCERSLERLKTPYIDLYQSHCWDNATPIEETLRTFDDLIRAGKVRYFGASNVVGWQLQKIVDRLETMGLDRCVALQQQYNLLCRHSEFEEFVVCQNEGIGVLPWSPLQGGLLTGKYKKDIKPDAHSGRIGFIHQDEKKALDAFPAWSQYEEDECYWKLIHIMSNIADTHGKTIPQVAIRWLIQKDVVASVIIGATSVQQVEDNMGASTGWELSVEENCSKSSDAILRSVCKQYTVNDRIRKEHSFAREVNGHGFNFGSIV